MKLAEHTEKIRQLIDKAFRNRLGRMGISPSGIQPVDGIPAEYRYDRKRVESIREIFINETGTAENAFEKLIEELTFTLFNRLAALKVIEAHALNPEIVTRRPQHGDRSFSHFLWLEQNPHGRNLEHDGLVQFLESQFDSLSADIPLFSLRYLFHLLPTAIEQNGIISAFNQIETDPQVEPEIWKSDDVLGWLYESYNNYKKAAHKESGDKTEYHKVSIQSQVYTPRWVVKFLVDNSLGKFYLEMFPDSEIKNKYKIANAPVTRVRTPKPLTEIRLIDLANGSGNFLLYGFDLFYDLYMDQIERYGANYDEARIPELIIRHNLHGIDIDDRAVQLAQLGLYIKAKRKQRSAKIDHFNIVSSDFFLPEFSKVKSLFENDKPLDKELEKIVSGLWSDLQQAFKFGSLLRLEEKLNSRLGDLAGEFERKQTELFAGITLANYEQFRVNFFHNLKHAVEHNAEKQGYSFLNIKTGDAITFLELMTQKYDVAVANPPYTDSADFGPELKKFVEANYKEPWKFNANLYAVFLKRCCEITDAEGYVALIHPHTFMFIKSYEDVRKYIIDKTHIDVLVDYGLDRVNLFGPGILLDATWYVLSKQMKDAPGLYFNITDNQQEKFKLSSLDQAYDDYLCGRNNQRVYTLDQSKLKIIEGWPFIYWISDGFREIFFKKKIQDYSKVSYGVKTGNNEALLRFWWELNVDNIYNKSNSVLWVRYTKGGTFNRWYGNIWLCVNWQNNAELIKKQKSYNLPNEDFIFKRTICFPDSSSKGICFRIIPETVIYDKGSSAIFSTIDIYELLAILNTKLISYIVDCLNPTVSKMPNDIKRIPIIKPMKDVAKLLSLLSKDCIRFKEDLACYHIIEYGYKNSPLIYYLTNTLREAVFSFLNYENYILLQVLINEAIINELVYEVYELSPKDRLQVETKMGKSVGALPVLPEARIAFLSSASVENESVRDFIKGLEVASYKEAGIREITGGFETLYQSNNDLEEFCIRHQVNPINVWYWFKEARILPSARAAEIALEFIADSIRTILAEDDDGIIPLISQLGEEKLLDRLEKHCLAKGFTSAQFMQLDGLLGKPLNEYLENNFFNDLSNHLNLFMYLPKTPFIWHLSSGEHQGLEVYVSIYKWNRDNLFRLKTVYVNRRVENLEYRLIQLKDSDTAQAQSEKEVIRLQLQEISGFAKKIDELIAEGYDPKLDDGVGKNIAPLQKKGMLRCDVLNKKQLEKYLNADW